MDNAKKSSEINLVDHERRIARVEARIDIVLALQLAQVGGIIGLIILVVDKI